MALAACGGPSPVDMQDHPITSSTPSRAAGQELVRNAEPDESCAEHPAAPESGTVRVPASQAAGSPSVTVPTDPQRVLALGVGAVDTACALGLQDRVVATSPLPAGAALLFPPRLAQAPVVDIREPDARARVEGVRPDVILVGADAGLTAAQLKALLGDDAAPVVSYDDAGSLWSDGVRRAGAALGRESAIDRQLAEFVESVDQTARAVTPSDTQVSVVTLDGSRPQVADPGILGVRVLEALGAGRPAGQQTANGKVLPTQEHAPVAKDPLSGDAVFVVLGAEPGREQQLREVFGSDRWHQLPAARERRVFVVDEIAWQGHGLVAARAALTDIAKKINGFAADG